MAKGGRCTKGCSKCVEGVNEKGKACSYTTRYLFFDYETMQETGVPNHVNVKDLTAHTNVL